VAQVVRVSVRGVGSREDLIEDVGVYVVHRDARGLEFDLGAAWGDVGRHCEMRLCAEIDIRERGNNRI
jgi:hypothetical protein